MRLRLVSFLSLTFAASLATADPAAPTPVSVRIVGQGEIRVVVADGATQPCDSSNNHMLFNGRARAGDEIKLAAASGSVCVDHTYGSLRESQWSGPSIWSGSNIGGYGGVRDAVLRGAVSTDIP